MQRRQFLTGLGLSAAALGGASLLWKAMQEDGASAPVATTANATSQQADLNMLCDLVIPTTDTPGAKDAGVADWVIYAAANHQAGMTPEKLDRFTTLLNENQNFAALTPAQQMEWLTPIDQLAFAWGGDKTELATLWHDVKVLILMGYYTSEIGASQELHYELVPGRFLPDVNIQDKEVRAWSNDWTAVMFG